MKKLLTLIVSIMILLGTSIEAFADTYVNGYIDKNGNYIAPHYRTDPDSYKSNNYSTYGNINPYTGEIGTKKVYDKTCLSYLKLEFIPRFKNIDDFIQTNNKWERIELYKKQFEYFCENYIKYLEHRKINNVEKPSYIYIPRISEEKFEDSCKTEKGIENLIKSESLKFYNSYSEYVEPGTGYSSPEKVFLLLDNKRNTYLDELDKLATNSYSMVEINKKYIPYKRAYYAVNLMQKELEYIKDYINNGCIKANIKNINKKDIIKEKQENNTTTIKTEINKKDPKQETKTTNKYERVDKILDNYNKKYPGVLVKLLPKLEKLLDKENFDNMLFGKNNLEKIELIKYIIEKIKKY